VCIRLFFAQYDTSTIKTSRAAVRTSGRLLLAISLLGTGIDAAFAQFTPPGVSRARTSGWVAVGFTQTISPRWAVSGYTGTSGQSTLDTYVFWKKRAISIVENEWTYTASKHWQVSLAGSLRFQNEYEDTPPYSPDEPAVRTELRAFTRIMYRHSEGSRLKWTHTLRPEYRRFFTPDWQPWPSPVQLRLRVGSRVSYALNANNTTQLILNNELLFSLNRVQDSSPGSLTWSPFKLNEDRLSMFIRRVIKKPAVNVDAGLMHQFWWDNSSCQIRYSTYFALGLQFRDPIKKQNSK